MNKLRQQVLAIWRRIPPHFQATIIFFGTTLGTLLTNQVSKMLLEPSAACWHWQCIRHAVSAAILASFVATRAFYMRPGAGPQNLNGAPPAA